MSLVLDTHREFLSDSRRLHAFEAALRETVRPDAVVLDLGAGTGILGLLACRAGARRVYAVDEGGILEVARQIARANGFGDRITPVQGLSTRVTLPEPVDVIVADQIGRWGFEAGVVQFFEDARRRGVLKSGAAFVPSAIDLHVAPVSAPDMWAQTNFWRSTVAGFDFTAGLPIALNTGYPTYFAAEQLLGVSRTVATIDLSAAAPSRIAGDVTVAIDRAATLHGIGGWFSAVLSPTVRMTNSPAAPDRINRRQVYLPIAHAVDVTPGMQVRVRVGIIAADLLVKWTVEVIAADGIVEHRFNHSTWHGMLVCPDDLAKTRPDFRPRLSPWGEARRSVLELCDGSNDVTRIEGEIRRRHSQLFAAPADAARFVAEVLLPYAQ